MSARRSLSHAQSVLVNRLATPVGSLLVLIILGRHSDRLLGEYALVMTFYFIMQMLPLLGLTPYVMRETARNPHNAGKYFASVGALSLAGCVVVDLAAAGFLRVVSYLAPVPEAVAIIGVLIFPGILVFIAELIFMSLHRAKPIAVVAIAENLARLVLTVLALEMGAGLLTLVWILFATRSAALVAYVVIMRREGILERGARPDAVIVRRTLAVLPTFLAGALLFVVVSRIDFLVLSMYHATDVIGLYAIAYRVYEISINILTALIMAVFPAIARRFVGARERFRVVLRNAFTAFVAAIALLAFVAGMLAPEYVLLLFPRQYPGPVPLTQLFALVLAISAVDFVASGMLYAFDRQGADTRAMAAGSALTVMLLFALVPHYAALGALAAKGATAVLQVALRLRAVRGAIGPLWRRAEIARLAAVAGSLVVAGWALADASLVARLLAIACALVGIPLGMVVLGLLRPLRLLRYYATGLHRDTAASTPSPVALAARDVRRYARKWRGAAAGGGAARQQALYALAMTRLAEAVRDSPRTLRVAAWAIDRISPRTIRELLDADDMARVLRAGGVAPADRPDTT